MSNDADETISPQLIEDALQRVIGSREIITSERKKRFLSFIVQETLAGHAHRIKAYAIAVDVFDRDPSFDPVIDPVVRIEAGRLRRCLEHYYLTKGAADPVRITIPKGGYVPQFILNEEAVRLDSQTTADDGQPNARELTDVYPAKTAEDQASAVTIIANPPLTPSQPALARRPRLIASILALSAVLIIALLGAALFLRSQISEKRADDRRADDHRTASVSHGSAI